MHVVEQDLHSVVLHQVGTLAPNRLFLFSDRLCGRRDQPQRPPALWARRDQVHRHQATHAQSDGGGALDAQPAEQLLDVLGVLAQRDEMRSYRACAKPPKVRRHRPKLSRQGLYLGPPQRAVERVAVYEHHARASTSIVEREFHVTTP